MTPQGIDGDAVAVLLIGGPSWNTAGTVRNTKILNNEMRDCNDGVMMIKMPQFAGNGSYHVNYPGTIVDYNHIYVDSEVYTDGNGNHNSNGIWAGTENAVDIKGGSSESDNPMIISNNYFWGYRRTDQNGGASGIWGTAFAVHYHVKNLEIKNNVIFNSSRGIAFSGLEGTPYTAEYVEIEGNILYDIGYKTDGGTGYCVIFNDAKDVSFIENIIVGVNEKSRWVEAGGMNNLDITCNIIINSAGYDGSRSSTTLGNNSFFDTYMQQSGDGDYYSSVSAANMANLIFTTDQLMNNPRNITLPGVKKTPSTPHSSSCSGSTPQMPGQASSPPPSSGTSYDPGTVFGIGKF
jgi:hypothetical protein